MRGARCGRAWFLLSDFNNKRYKYFNEEYHISLTLVFKSLNLGSYPSKIQLNWCPDRLVCVKLVVRYVGWLVGGVSDVLLVCPEIRLQIQPPLYYTPPTLFRKQSLIPDQIISIRIVLFRSKEFTSNKHKASSKISNQMLMRDIVMVCWFISTGTDERTTCTMFETR